MTNQSAIYRRKLKRMVTLLKQLHPLVERLPAPLPRPGSEAFKGGAAMDAKTAQSRQEAYEKADSKRLDRSAAPFWLAQMTMEERRSRS